MFYTQLEAAKEGFVTDEMKIVAQKEGIPEERLRELVAAGQVVIPCNRNHICIDLRESAKLCGPRLMSTWGGHREM